MTARTGLLVLYGLCDEWTARRQLIGAVGGEPDHLDDAFEASTRTTAAPDPAARRAEIEALIAATT